MCHEEFKTEILNLLSRTQSGASSEIMTRKLATVEATLFPDPIIPSPALKCPILFWPWRLQACTQATRGQFGNWIEPFQPTETVVRSKMMDFILALNQSRSAMSSWRIHRPVFAFIQQPQVVRLGGYSTVLKGLDERRMQYQGKNFQFSWSDFEKLAWAVHENTLNRYTLFVSIRCRQQRNVDPDTYSSAQVLFELQTSASSQESETSRLSRCLSKTHSIWQSFDHFHHVLEKHWSCMKWTAWLEEWHWLSIDDVGYKLLQPFPQIHTQRISKIKICPTKLGVFEMTFHCFEHDSAVMRNNLDQDSFTAATWYVVSYCMMYATQICGNMQAGLFCPSDWTGSWSNSGQSLDLFVILKDQPNLHGVGTTLESELLASRIA